MVSCTRTTSWHPYLPPTKLTLKVFGQILGDPKGFAVAGAAESPTHMRSCAHHAYGWAFCRQCSSSPVNSSAAIHRIIHDGIAGAASGGVWHII